MNAERLHASVHLLAELECRHKMPTGYWEQAKMATLVNVLLLGPCLNDFERITRAWAIAAGYFEAEWDLVDETIRWHFIDLCEMGLRYAEAHCRVLQSEEA